MDDETVREKLKKVKTMKYEPTWEEVWDTGYGNKRAIMAMKNTDLDVQRLLAVRRAIECEEISMDLTTLRNASKSYFLGLYSRIVEKDKQRKLLDLLTSKPSNYVLVNKMKQLEQLVELLIDEQDIALDTETSGLEWDKDSHLVGISMTLPNADWHVYIPLRHNEGEQLPVEVVMEYLAPLLEDTELGKVLHNAKFDYHMFMREGVQLKGIICDTMVAMHILHENEPSYSLKNLVSKYGANFGFEGPQEDYDTLFGRVGFDTVPIDYGMVYACKDTHMTWELYKWQQTYFKKNPRLKGLYLRVELPLLQVVCDMEENGLPIDFGFAYQYGQELSKWVETKEQELSEQLNNININSNQQLAGIMYDQWGLNPPRKGRVVDAETLKMFAPDYPVLKELLEYREHHKLLNTYILPLPQKVGKDDRLHGQFRQIGAKTGRFSSSDPNLQNIPGSARPLVKAPEGKVIVGIDYSQIEPRLLAHMSEDSDFQKPYLEGTDLYSSLASKVFNIPLEECGDGSKYRKMMKTGLLATMYGTSKFTLGRQLGVTPDEAQEFIQDFLDTYWGVKWFIASTHEFVERNDYVETMFNRKRRFPGHSNVTRAVEEGDKSYKTLSTYERVARQAVNARIQGSASDLMKIAMVRVNALIKSWGPEYLMLATIHDEILLEVPEAITEAQIASIEQVMTDVVKLKVPLKVDTAFMYSWGKEINKKEWFQSRTM